MTSGWHAASCLRPKCAREQGFVVPIKPKGRRQNECGKLSVDSCRTRHATMLAERFSHPKAVMVHPSGALANKLTATCQGPGDLRHARIAEPSPMASSDTLALEDSIPIYPGKIAMEEKIHQMAGKLTCNVLITPVHAACVWDSSARKVFLTPPAASFPGLPVPNPSSDRHQSLHCARCEQGTGAKQHPQH